MELVTTASQPTIYVVGKLFSFSFVFSIFFMCGVAQITAPRFWIYHFANAFQLCCFKAFRDLRKD